MSAEGSKKKRRGGAGRRRNRGGRHDSNLFDDLDGLEVYEIRERLAQHRAGLRATEQQHESLQSERRGLISTVQLLREAVGKSSGISRERGKLLKELRERRKRVDEQRNIRDSINERIAPPSSLIDSLLEKTLKRLTVLPDDLLKMPNLPTEIKQFSFLFELQQMHAQKKLSDAAHNEYVQLMRKQQKTIDGLDALKDEREQISSETTSENPRMKEMKVNRKEEKQLNERIASMLDTILAQRDEIKGHRREIGRLEAFLRIRTDAERKGHTVQPRIEDIQQRAASGGTLSLEDLSRLMSSGGLSDLDSRKKEEPSQSTRAEPPKPKRRKAKARRGKPGRQKQPQD
uniref:ATPase involved in DNA repair n=1 Tax=uncultured marine group II/III euryarchaeote KM3_64_C08 TaxID=1456479 RepID=A0A075HD52_9EURY|nr:ATPase involved in DNA repair [uncultured marine group II/III euryarchaeote KM3_64_C08]